MDGVSGYIAIVRRRGTGLVYNINYRSPEQFDNHMEQNKHGISWAKLFELETGLEVSSFPKGGE